MDENIIRISNAETFRSSEWTMTIDLARVADLAGKKIKSQEGDYYFTAYPIARARKLLKLIREYGTEADLEKCDRFFTPFRNERLYKIWKELGG